MFQKVLIVEDHESMNYSMQLTLKNLGIEQDPKNYVYYCDDALSRIIKAKSENNPFELLITDLSFDEGLPDQQLTDGTQLIQAARVIQPDLKVLVFSGKNRLSEAQALFDQFHIDGFVPKGRGDVKDLETAIYAIYQLRKYLSPNLKKTINEKVYHFEKLDLAIVSLLLEGVPQKNMQERLAQMGVMPNSLSSVEKRLKSMREALDFHTNTQLIAYCKDKKLV